MTDAQLEAKFRGWPMPVLGARALQRADRGLLGRRWRLDVRALARLDAPV